MRVEITTLLLLLLCSFSYGQVDSSALYAERLTANDIHIDILDIDRQKIVSASRTLQAVEDLPFTVYVITKEDIRNNGYNTLVDALKMVPGIRVSQPGSGPDGETFLMRGLKGNEYTKILINNIPVKPIGIKGMPIGAQLPIRQAERIEVIFGPVAALYGADASAGVVNIILKESERPLYTKADISFGAEQFSSMNILFGGKAGKRKKMLKYNVFGNFTTLTHRRIYSDNGPLYDPATYSHDSLYLSHPNYVSKDTAGLLPELSNLPHQSRSIGMELSYGAFDLTLINMYRRDHSSIGLNPSAYSYANPLNFVGENLYQGHLGYNKKTERVGFSLAANFLMYESDKNSSYHIVSSLFNRALVIASDADTQSPDPWINRMGRYFDNFISGNRYLYDRKIDFSLDATLNVQLFDKIEWMTGITPRVLASKSEYFLRTPYPNQNEDHTVTSGGHTDDAELSGFTQLFFNGNKLKGVMGIQSTLQTNFKNVSSSKIFPRVAFLYKFTPDFSLRVFYGSAFRSPSTYYSKNSYTIKTGNYEWIQLGYYPLKPEITKSFETGLRWRINENVFTDITFFSSITENLIESDFEFEYDLTGTDIKRVTLGYFNDGNSFGKVKGVQSALMWNNLIPSIKLNSSFHFTITKGSELKPGNLLETDFLREQPLMLAQLKLSAQPMEGVYIYLDNLFVSKTHNKSDIVKNIFDRFETLPSYYTMDLSVLGRLTEHFQISFKLKNVFNTNYTGLAATGTNDDLLWNPQSRRTWELGFSYRVE
jgi:hemoglobin/transferrin/lactoferrin receptor protein